jgi:N-acylneuraminate cytidylyltransferase
MTSKTVAIIPARGGSKGIPDKNLQHVGGIPLLARTIHALQLSSSVSAVYVSTDSESIARLASAYGAEVIMRPNDLSSDSASSESALLHAIEMIESRGQHPTSIVFAQCTSPFIEPADVDGVINLLEDHDCALTVTENHAFIWRNSAEGSAIGINHNPIERLPRQMLPAEYRETGALYAFSTKEFKSVKHRFFGKIGMFNVPNSRSMEIDDPYDLVLANQLSTISKIAPTIEMLRIIKAVIFDFDGVITNNLVHLDENGTETVVCSRSDGMGIQMLRAAGIQLLILSKEQNQVVTSRGKKLEVEVIQGCDNKRERLEEWLTEHHLQPNEVAYMGNDINDCECMDYVGLSVAPADAHPAVDPATIWKMNAKGGYGAVRELADALLLSQTTPLS